MTAPKTFTFQHNGTDYTIPAFVALPIGVLRKGRKAKDEMDQVFTMLEAVMGEDSPELAAIDTMDPVQFEAFLKGWTQGAGAGEA